MERLKSIIIIILSVMLFSVWQVYAGNPAGPGTPPASTSSYTLNDIYNRLSYGIAGSESTFTEPTSGPSTGTMHTLNEIMSAAPNLDETNGATAADVASGKTFWGLTEGEWGLQTGSALETVCTERHAQYDVPDAQTYPWQVSIQRLINGQWQHICGGALYATNKVLTTASCLDGISSGFMLRVGLGSHDLQQQSSHVSGSSLIKHPSYDPNADGQPNDIAVLRLVSHVTTSSTISPILLAQASDGDFASQQATLTGWGKTYTGVSLDNKILQHESSIVLTNANCTTEYNGISGVAINSGHICLDESDPIDTCTGDLGGPIVSGSLLIGLQSFEVFEDPNLPRVATRISSFYDWIQAQ